MPTTGYGTKNTSTGTQLQQISLFPPDADLLAPEWFDPAHWVRTRGKKAVDRWGQFFPSAEAMRLWTAEGGDHGAGVVPSTIQHDKLGLTVVDVDHGDADELVAAYAPLAVVPSRRRNGRHLYYVDDQPRKNGKFRWRGCAGDVRSREGGYIVCHGNAIEIVDHALAGVCRNAKPILFPSHLLGDPVGAGPRKSSSSSSSSTPPVAASPLLSEALEEAHRLGPFTRLSRVPEGGRHPALVRASLRWAGRRTWNGRTLTETGIATGCLRLALGLSGDDFADDEALGIVGWALNCRRAWAALGWQSTDAFKATQARRIRSRWHDQPELFDGRVSEILRLHDDGMTQTRIAVAVGCSQPNVSRILRANRAKSDPKYAYQ